MAANYIKQVIMAIDNMISLSLTNEELQTIDNALATIESVMSNKFINLTPDERKSYSQVSDKTEDWIGRVKTYMAQSPELVLGHIDVAEYNADYEARQAILPRKRRLKNIFELFDDTCMLIGSDLHYNAIAYYKGLKAEAATNAPGAKTIYADLSSRFPGRPSGLKKNV
jgi:hypothetical protein